MSSLKIPPTDTELLVRPPTARRAFRVRVLRVESWSTRHGPVHAIIAGRIRRKAGVPTLMRRESWVVSPADILEPRMYTLARAERLDRINPHLPGTGETRRLDVLSREAGYVHHLGAYSAVRTLETDIHMSPGPDGHLMVGRNMPTPDEPQTPTVPCKDPALSSSPT